LEYPEKYEAIITLKGGEELLLRPVKPTDVKLTMDFYKKLSDRTKYLRFFTPKREAREDRVEKFTSVDYETSMVMVAVHDDVMVGAARFDWDEREKVLELAETVRDDWQGKGLGTILFKKIVEIAREKGHRTMTAIILDENKKALSILQSNVKVVKSGFEGNFLRITFET
jgi:acetyltransferase